MSDMILNTECPGCDDIFDDSDDVYGTSCGHLFHFACLNDWLRRCTSCPKCYKYCPSTFKIYISLDESKDKLHNAAGEDTKLESSNEKITRLIVEVNQSRNNFLQLQKRFTAIENSKREFREKIEELEESEKNFFHLQGQCKDSSQQVKQLVEKISRLNIKNEGKAKELLLKRLENETLKVNLDAKQTTSVVLLDEKVNCLEQKLKHISAELVKEISKSTQLSIENMKLKSCLNVLSSMEKNNEVLAVEDEIKSNIKPNREILKEPILPICDDIKENAEKCSTDTYNVVLIKQFPLNEIVWPLEYVILNLAAKMRVSIPLDDLIKVNLLKGNRKSTKAQLTVQFKSSAAKDKFISNKNCLKNYYPSSGAPTIDDLHEVFTYAKDKLINNGFTKVFCKNYKIYANQIGKPEAVHIQSKSQVDNLYIKGLIIKNLLDLYI